MYRLLLVLLLVGCSVDPYEAPPLDPVELATCEAVGGEYELIFDLDQPEYKCCFVALCKVGTDCPRFCDDV